MIRFRRQRGAPFRLRLAAPLPLDGVQIASSLRDAIGNAWALAVTITDPQAGVFDLDAGVDARVLPAGRLWFDIRFTRDDIQIHTMTFGLFLVDDLDAANLAIVARQRLAGRARVDGQVYLTREGEMLDLICHRELGADSYAPQVLDANPRLAELGPVYPAGVALFLPDAAALAPRASARITLWGRA